ncbi:MAG: N-acetylmuramoyl-L-alanine amidase [Zoogloeaceae bacterium]|jgi:N-acetylmuramoyl-L-alanine amidase|nr:N-acetylmuramoyl-L-alanine amidase [Zoogloeaceae bacterium]
MSDAFDEFRPSRRAVLGYAAAVLTLSVTPLRNALAAALPTVLAVRVWPALDYTRITIECDQPIRFTHSMVREPNRLVLDIEDVEFNSVLSSLPEKIAEADPYIKLIRAGRNRPGVVRIVVELKADVKPQVFTLQPVGKYGYRLVTDLYPVEEVDPLAALLKEEEKKAATRPDPSKPNPPQTKPQISRLVTIVLDPGHGGEDPGAIGRRGSYEKNVTLSIARRLKAKIDAEPNMRSMLTRDGDFFIPLQERVYKARRVQADLFVSVHADAFMKPTARGSSVFILSETGASSSAARWLAQRENAADMIGGVNLKVKDQHLARTLLDLSQTATINDSLKLGKDVLGELGRINTLHKGQVEQAGFAVLKAPDIPSILVETAFISNPEEEQRLTDERYQEQMADAILRGIRQYFIKNPPQPKSRLALLG